MHFAYQIIPVLSLIFFTSVTASPVAKNERADGIRYFGGEFERLVNANTRFPITCKVDTENNLGTSSFKFDNIQQIWDYISLTSKSDETCTSSGQGRDDCSAKWWPNGLKWVQLNYSRDYQRSGNPQVSVIKLNSITTYTAVSIIIAF